MYFLLLSESRGEIVFLLFPSAGFCPRQDHLVCCSSNSKSTALTDCHLCLNTLFAARFDSGRAFNSKRSSFFPSLTMMQVGHGCQSQQWHKKKKKACDVDALVCVCVSVYLQATRPVSSSPQSSQRESRLCGGSASNARLAAAVRIKERMRWVGWANMADRQPNSVCEHSSLLKCQIEMLIDVSVVSGIELF